AAVRPAEGARIHDGTRAMRPVRLKAGNRVRKGFVTVEAVAISAADRESGHESGVVAISIALQHVLGGVTGIALQHDAHAAALRSMNAEVNSLRAPFGAYRKSSIYGGNIIRGRGFPAAGVSIGHPAAQLQEWCAQAPRLRASGPSDLQLPHRDGLRSVREHHSHFQCVTTRANGGKL